MALNSRWLLLAAGLVLFHSTAGLAMEMLPTAVPFCPPLPPASGETIRIKSGDVRKLVWEASHGKPGITLLLEDGLYQLSVDQSIEIEVPNLTLRSLSGNRDAVTIDGGRNNVSINANGVTVAEVTLRRPNFHNVQVRGERGVLGARIYRVHAVDSGQQLVKVSTGDGRIGKFGDGGLVACSLLEYSTVSHGTAVSPPSYTNGIDILAGKGWVIRDNVLRRIRSASGPTGPAILVWRNSQDTVVTRNLIVDCWRGIALGLMSPDRLARGGPGVVYDHQNGLVDHNVILALREPADAALETNYARNTRIIHNTIYYKPGLRHEVSWSIEYRFAPTTAVIRNNLTNLPIRKRFPFPDRDAVIEGNLTDAQTHWFRALNNEDVHLVPGSPPIDQGVRDPGPFLDIDGANGALGGAPDAGADEFSERMN